MDSRILVEYKGKVYEYEKPKRVIDILKDLNLNPLEHVVIVNDEIYTEDRVVKSGSKVVIKKVTSAG
ncbi:ubiquitin family protein [Pseudothermotoga thermarum]|uniref:ThiamineS protein n=1 Tax=Pseudothermotoga thermarum DSM 5069 TaxID=688269 RepID=F7YTQ5_9THEM|nr:hypothetical protein [Pseudothermotoga thermarum]AEH51282.1 hypothetical protein Theth_1210 [Pseudothermotoga thermarum DSM 5069]